MSSDLEIAAAATLRMFKSRPKPDASSFDYASIPQTSVTVLRASRREITSRVKRQTEDMLAAGEQLRTAKQLLQGRFVEWIQAELLISVRTAENWMRAAEVLGDECATVANLPPTTAYMLAAKSTPHIARKEIIDTLKAGAPLEVTVIERRVRQARQEAEQERRNAKIPLEKRKRLAAAKKRREAEWKRYKEERDREDQALRDEGERIAGQLRELLTPDAIAVVIHLLGSPGLLMASAKRSLATA